MAEQKYAYVREEDLLAKVRQKLDRELIAELMNFTDAMTKLPKGKKLKFMGAERADTPRKHVEHMVLGALYKDLYKVPYAELDGSLVLGYIISETSWRNNVKRLRKVFWMWAWERQILLGNLGEWEQAAKKHHFTGCVKDVCLWMDSSDVPIENRPDRGSKSDWWSGKDGHPANRFLTLQDGQGLVRKVWGGYSPKYFDAHFVLFDREFFQRYLEGATIVADEHFHTVNDDMDDPVFVTHIKENSEPKSKKRKRDPYDDDEEELYEQQTFGVTSMTGPKVKHNELVKKARATIESPYGNEKQKFEVLTEPWPENFTQLAYLFTFSVGVYNYNKRKKMRRG